MRFTNKNKRPICLKSYYYFNSKIQYKNKTLTYYSIITPILNYLKELKGEI